MPGLTLCSLEAFWKTACVKHPHHHSNRRSNLSPPQRFAKPLVCLSLAEIAALLSERDVGTVDHPKLIAMAQKQLVKLDERVARIRVFRPLIAAVAGGDMAKFSINGKPVEVNAPSQTPALWIIREELNLLGTKFGCGKGLCGACTIHLNGAAIRSCITPLSAIEGQNIHTVESLSDGAGGLHPLQKAWHEGNVSQCGYCQPGQLMTAAALIGTAAKGSPINEDDIRSAMSGNLCRCGTYQRAVVAVQKVALDMKAGK